MNRELVIRKSNTIRDLLQEPRYRKPLEGAIPKHLTVDRLLRTVMTAIRTNPSLLDCSRDSLLAAVMACAQLGLEPEPFLGQAYLVPFKNEVVFIPGYRGYIALARRSGEVQSVSSQVVYENDYFRLQYGTDEKLEHMPTDGDRGEPKGAYVIFKYKDGGHSFDYMTAADINKIRDNFSKQPNGMMWKDNWAEGAKKTVIRRHVKLVPLAVEIQRAAALEDRAYGGESQIDMIFPEVEESPKQVGGKSFWITLDDYYKETYPGKSLPDAKKLEAFIKATAEGQEMESETIMEAAALNIGGFLKQYDTWIMKQAEGEETERILPFSKLKRSGLIAWEKENRDKLPQMPQATQTAFIEKWERITGAVYAEWLGENAEAEQPKEETEGGEAKTQVENETVQEELVTCPNTQEEMKTSYCNSHCRQREGCPIFA